MLKLPKIVATLIFCVLNLAILPATAASPVAKIGGACFKVGATAQSKSSTLICAKNGKRLTWTKFIAKPTPTPSPTSSTPKPTPAATPTPVPSSTSTPIPKPHTKNQIPITLPVPISGAITFANAESKFAQISTVAWQRVQDSIAANPSVDIPTTIDIGPNTKADLESITFSLNRLYKLFSGFEHFSSYTGFVYNAQDLQWAQDDAAAQFKKLGITGFMKNPQAIKQQSEAGCEMNGSIAINCYGGMALTFKDGGSNAGASFYGVENTYTQNGQKLDFWTAAQKYQNGAMTQVTHEGMHNYQFAQFFNKPFTPGQNTASDQSHAFTPWWYSEGQANAIGISVFMVNLQDYLISRDRTVTRRPDSRAKPPAMTADGLEKFLKEFQTTGPENYNWSLAYSIGFAAVEALIAIGGPESTLALYALGGNGEDWETAFKHVYGISWDEGATVLSKVLAAEYKAKPLES